MGTTSTVATKSTRAVNGAGRRRKKVKDGADETRAKVKRRPDPALWGVPNVRAQRFSLHQNFATGGSRKVGLKGIEGVVRYHWPLSVLSVDWIRQHWGGGSFQANWLVVDNGKLMPAGRSRVVELDSGPVGARARNGATPPGIGYAQPQSSAWPTASGPPDGFAAPYPAQPMPPEVVDMRVKAANEIAEIRIRTERELFAEKLDWQRRMSDERYERLETRIDELGDRRGGYDEPEEPGEWDWVKQLLQQLQPTIKAVLPELLRRLGAGAVLPPKG